MKTLLSTVLLYLQGVQGKSPHFCNFVQKVDLKNRYDATSEHAQDDGNGDLDNSSMDSLQTDKDLLAQWRKRSAM